MAFEEGKSWNWNEEIVSRATQPENFVVVTGGVGKSCDLFEDISDNAYTLLSTSQSNWSTDEELGSRGTMTFVTHDSNSEENSQPRHYKSLTAIYNETEPIELAEEKLLIMGINELVNYSQIAKEGEWRRAMKIEMDVVEKNKTWELTELPPR